MLDFTKLRDPAWQASFREKEAARQEAIEKKDEELCELVGICRGHYEQLTDKERGLVNTCQHVISRFGVISERQENWLRDIARRLDPEAMCVNKPIKPASGPSM